MLAKYYMNKSLAELVCPLLNTRMSRSLNVIWNQWRIQDFPEGGGVNPPGGA